MPSAQWVTVCVDACPKTSFLIVYGAAYPAGNTVSVSDPYFNFSASNTGTSVTDADGVPRPVIEVVCQGPKPAVNLDKVPSFLTPDRAARVYGADDLTVTFYNPSGGPYAVKVYRYLPPEN